MLSEARFARKISGNNIIIICHLSPSQQETTNSIWQLQTANIIKALLYLLYFEWQKLMHAVETFLYIKQRGPL